MNQAIKLISEALSHAGEDQQTVERLTRLEKRRITPSRELPPMEFLFRLFGKPCFPRGELVGLTGRPKSGKTFVSSILMSLCFREEVLTMTRMSPTPLRVLWYDTEQSDESTQDILCNRIMPMIYPNSPPTDERDLMADLFGNDSSPGGMDGPFSVFNVRQEPWLERMPLLEAAINHCRPDFVIVDGIRDLVNDINDGVLAQDTIERLMHLASEMHCCIVCILHQNKNAEDKNLRGWIGTELTHKAFEVYDCEKGGDRVFSLSQHLTRKYDILDTLKYIVNDNGIPQIACIENIIENERRQYYTDVNSRPAINNKYVVFRNSSCTKINVALLFADAMPEEGTMYVAKDVQEKVMRLANITSVFFYNKQREQALKEGIIRKTANEFGYIAYYRPKESSAAAAPAEPDLFGNSPDDVPF